MQNFVFFFFLHLHLQPFLLCFNFVLVLGSHFKAFTVEASLPLHSRARYFLGLATKGT
jgi:hypothetical protein